MMQRVRERNGAGLRLLTGPITSPTLLRQLAICSRPFQTQVGMSMTRSETKPQSPVPGSPSAVRSTRFHSSTGRRRSFASMRIRSGLVRRRSAMRRHWPRAAMRRIAGTHFSRTLCRSSRS